MTTFKIKTTAEYTLSVILMKKIKMRMTNKLSKTPTVPMTM